MWRDTRGTAGILCIWGQVCAFGSMKRGKMRKEKETQISIRPCGMEGRDGILRAFCSPARAGATRGGALSKLKRLRPGNLLRGQQGEEFEREGMRMEPPTSKYLFLLRRASAEVTLSCRQLGQ